MEYMSNFKTNTFYYGDGIYYVIIHDFAGHQFDAWMYEKDGENRTYLMTLKDTTPIRDVKENIITEIEALIEQKKAV